MVSAGAGYQGVLHEDVGVFCQFSGCFSQIAERGSVGAAWSDVSAATQRAAKARDCPGSGAPRSKPAHPRPLYLRTAQSRSADSRQAFPSAHFISNTRASCIERFYFSLNMPELRSKRQFHSLRYCYLIN